IFPLVFAFFVKISIFAAMDSPFERPQNPSPPPSSPSTPVDAQEFLFPSVSSGLNRQHSDSMSSDGYETDSQLGDDVPLSLTASSSMESLPTDEPPSFILAAVPVRFYGAYVGKHANLPPNIGRYLMTNRRFTIDDDDEERSKRMRTENSVDSDDDELPTDESTFIGNHSDDRKDKSDDDDLYEF
ncbi:hypothetical protein PENTCL1PPCAC_28777, partial [Pristionchus entomophagus]